MIKLDMVDWLLRAGQVHKGVETMRDFLLKRQQLSLVSEEALTDARQLSLSIDQTLQAVPTKALPRKQNFSTFSPTNV